MGNELAKVTSADYKKQTARCIAAMIETLDSFGKKPTSALLDGWGMAFTSRQFPFELIEPTCAWFCTHGSKFPAPAEFMDRGYELQERKRIDVLLASTKRALKEAEEVAALDRSRRNIEAGIDPDELLPIDAVLPVLGKLETRMLPESIEEVV